MATGMLSSQRSSRHEHFILTSPQPRPPQASPKPEHRYLSTSATYFGATSRAAPMGSGFKPAGPRGAGYTLRDEVSA